MQQYGRTPPEPSRDKRESSDIDAKREMSDDIRPYPIGLVLHGARVLVVGGGTVATRRVPALLDAGADVVLVAPEITPALRGLADAGRLTWEARSFIRSDVDGCWLVHAALDDPAAAAEVSTAAADARIFCVRADDRRAATAWTPAVTRHGPVTVAVLAGGDPRRSMAVRDRIAAGLESGGLDRPADDRAAGTAATDVRGDGTSGGDVRPPEMPAGDMPPTAAGAVGAPWAGMTAAAAAAMEARPGTVALVGAGPGDPELITVRGRRLLAAASVVIADRLAPGMLLDELGPDVELVDASKIPYGPQATQDEINRIMVERARAGAFVVRLKGGDPYVFGRGGEEVLACAEAGVPVLVVPGVTSAIAVPSAAGIPVTHRGITHEFTVVSGHLAPGHPASLVDWATLGRMRGTVCVLMGLTNLAAIAEALIAGGRPPTTPAAVIQEGTTAHERVVTAPLRDLAAAAMAAGLRTPAIAVVGDVVLALGRTADLA